MEKTKKQNLALALILSFLVALLGGAVWGLIYAMGWFVSIIAFVTAFGMFAVFMKFYNKLNWVPITWTLVWIILLNIISSFLAIVISVSIQASVSFAVALEATLEVIPDYIGGLAFDLMLGIAFSVLGVVTYYKTYKRQRGQSENVNQQPITYTTLEENSLDNLGSNSTSENKESLAENQEKTEENK